MPLLLRKADYKSMRGFFLKCFSLFLHWKNADWINLLWLSFSFNWIRKEIHDNPNFPFLLCLLFTISAVYCQQLSSLNQKILSAPKILFNFFLYLPSMQCVKPVRWFDLGFWQKKVEQFQTNETKLFELFQQKSKPKPFDKLPLYEFNLERILKCGIKEISWNNDFPFIALTFS
jgi:hypothetical protein